MSASGFKSYSRVFAREIGQTDLVLPTHNARQADLIIPSGERVSWCYFSGALTEINTGGKGGGYIRVADPTGVLILYIRPHSQEILEILGTLSPPVFVSLIATIESDTRPGESEFRLILERIDPSDRTTRDRWIVRTADLTLSRLDMISQALSGKPVGEDVRKAVARYKSSPRQLRFLATMVEKALGQVQLSSPGKEEESDADESASSSDTAEKVMVLIRQRSGPRGISVQELVVTAGKAGIAEQDLMETIRSLIADDELYQPSSGFVKIL